MNSNSGKNPPLVLSETDRQILIALQKEANPNIKQLANKLNLSKTPVYNRIKQLEEAGFIKGYVALLDRKMVDVSLVVFCAVSLTIQNAEYISLFNNEIKKLDEIVECYLTGGVFDFILKVMVKDLEAYNNFASNKLAQIQNVGKIQSSFVLTEVKSSTAVPL
ncbi:Lrp/AsnC family transcriptional regulator [Myroides odoratimimus]|uniref:Lrp/AsnC family transcriptional regulator n=1 Tax=Myroides odoratimimus TaxID=76832 RepID=UPI0029C00E1C|nr:Lrp/AsnC family transcriptional regulator [Myroides odoratimimus]MDX4973900.1 Lrp/AsnC family transcriptional regulator [Myroides odoratimimus]